MLPARRNRLLQWLLFRYIGWAARRQFDSARLWGEAPWLAEDASYPLVFYSNHQTWWDGFLETLLARRYGQTLWLMMEERNLRKFPAFRVAGVFGVDLESEAGRGQALLYAARRLRERRGRAALYLYPHGRLVPAHAEWPDFQGGVEALLRLAPAARAVPVAKEIAYGRFRDAEVFLELGQPLCGQTSELEAALRATRDRLRARIAAGEEDGAAWLLRPKAWSTGRT